MPLTEMLIPAPPTIVLVIYCGPIPSENAEDDEGITNCVWPIRIGSDKLFTLAMLIHWRALPSSLAAIWNRLPPTTVILRMSIAAAG